MSGLGDLVVNLSANTQGFDKGIDKAKTGLNEFGKVGPRSVNPVTRAFSALTAVAVGTAGTLSALSLDITKGLAVGMVGVGAAAWGLQSRIGDLAGVADKAMQTGLSGAFLQKLEFAADQSGVSAETLTGGIKKLTLMIGQAANGSKEAADTLKSFGLSAKELRSLSPEQQFMRIADKISDIPSAAGRAAAAVKVFGKSGIEMTTLFAGGLDDITKLMQDAKDIGIGLDDEQLAQIAAADDSLQKMYASVGAMVDQVAVGLAPAFEAVSEKVTGLIGPVTNLFDAFNNLDNKWTWAGDTLVAAFDVAMETIKVHWKQMIIDLIDETASFNWDVANLAFDITNPGLLAQRGADMALQMGAGQGGQDGLQAAQNRLAGLIGQFQEQQGVNGKGAQPGFNRSWMELKPPKSFTEAWTGITDALSPITSQLEAGASGFIDRAKIQAGAVGGMLSNWLGTDRKTQGMTPRLAGAMTGGSVEAYSTLVQAMMTRGKDPVVAATEKQTKDLIKGLKPKKEYKNIESFVSL